MIIYNNDNDNDNGNDKTTTTSTVRECNEAKRPDYGSEGVDLGGGQGVKRAYRGSYEAIGLV